MGVELRLQTVTNAGRGWPAERVLAMINGHDKCTNYLTPAAICKKKKI